MVNDGRVVGARLHMEYFSIFMAQVYGAPTLVWTLGFVMSAVSGYMLHSYVGDYPIAIFSSFVLFASILIAHVAFTELGVFFTTDRESNIAASAGAAICSVTLITVVMMRLWHAARAGYKDLSD
jgi:hypothetical protein